MILLGFCDDVFDLRWSVKIFSSFLATLPLLVAYTGSTSVVLVCIFVPFLFFSFFIFHFFCSQVLFGSFQEWRPFSRLMCSLLMLPQCSWTWASSIISTWRCWACFAPTRSTSLRG